MGQFLVTDDGFIMERHPEGHLVATDLCVEQAPMSEATAGLWFVRNMSDEPLDWAAAGYGTREAAVEAALVQLRRGRPGVG